MARRRSITDVLDTEHDSADHDESAHETPRTETKKATAKNLRAVSPVTATTDDDSEHDRKLNVPMSQRMLEALQLARVHDRIPQAARVRAMIRLWEADPDVRARVDQDAQRGR